MEQLVDKFSDEEPDLFPKPVRTGDHMYTQRPGFNKYEGGILLKKNMLIYFILVILNQ